MLGQDDKCFCCGKPFSGRVRHLADTGEDQVVFVGSDCARFIAAACNDGYRRPKQAGPALYPFRGKCEVEFEISGEGSEQRCSFSDFAKAVQFGRRITRDGTAWPSSAVVRVYTRESDFAPWKLLRHMPPTEIVDGEAQ